MFEVICVSLIFFVKGLCCFIGLYIVVVVPTVINVHISCYEHFARTCRLELANTAFPALRRHTTVYLKRNEVKFTLSRVRDFYSEVMSELLQVD